MQKGLSVSFIPLVKRRMAGVKTVSSGAVNRQIPQDEFHQTLRRYQQEAAGQRHSMLKVVEGLWKSEGFSTTFGKYRLPENTLNDTRIPRESLGIAHVGYGAASTEFARFDANTLHEVAATKCNPDYQNCMYEGIGSILRIYEPGFFKFMCSAMGLIPKGAPPGPDKTGFFAKFLSGFSPEQQRLITHGYGRLIAFSNLSIYKAINEARSLPADRVAPAEMGIAFAFAMMNAEDMPRILENSAIDYPEPVRSSFQNGLVYALIFCDWFAPGLLAAWKAAGSLEGKLIALASDEAEKNQKRGSLLPFALENPLGGSLNITASSPR